MKNYKSEDIKVDAVQLNTIKIAVYLLFSLIILAAAYLLLYDGLMYYLFEFFLSWAYLLRFLALVPFVLILHFIFSNIDKKLFGNQLLISFNDQNIQLATEKNNYIIPYEQLKSVILTRKNNTYATLEIHAEKVLHFKLGSWKSNLKDVQFGDYWNTLKKELKQKDFQYHSDSGKQNKIVVVREILCADYSDYLSKQKIKKKRIFIFLAFYFLFIIGLVLYIIPKFSKDGISIYNGKQIGTSYFEEYQNQVYFLKAGDGYFLVPDADHLNFRSLETQDEIYSNAGADHKSVYWQDHKISLLNPSSAVYLGGDYIKDPKNVYFRDQQLKNIDVATFQAVQHSQYNTPVYYFGKDKNNVFYKTIPLHGLQPETAQSFDNSARYIKDNQTVFYKNILLKGLNAGQTKIYDPKNYRTAYATDGKHHFFNDRPAPGTASNKYFGNTAIDLRTFKLLIPSEKGSYLYLFGDASHLYFYDENLERLIMIYKFNEPVKLSFLENGSFTDGKARYTLNVRKIISRGKSSTTLRGYNTEILRIEKLKEPVRIASYASTNIEWKKDD